MNQYSVLAIFGQSGHIGAKPQNMPYFVTWLRLRDMKRYPLVTPSKRHSVILRHSFRILRSGKIRGYQ